MSDLPSWWPCWTDGLRIVPMSHKDARGPCSVSFSVARSWWGWAVWQEWAWENL